jgi:hypothetical protein
LQRGSRGGYHGCRYLRWFLRHADKGTRVIQQETRTVVIETQGCKLNQADSQLLAQRFAAAGYDLVSSDSAADVYVLNSCTVTHIADRKARQAIRALRQRNPEALLVVAGVLRPASASRGGAGGGGEPGGGQQR